MDHKQEPCSLKTLYNNVLLKKLIKRNFFDIVFEQKHECCFFKNQINHVGMKSMVESFI